MTKPTKCPECGGEGRNYEYFPGDQTPFIECPTCNGTGKAKPTAAEVEKVENWLEGCVNGNWRPFAKALDLLRSLAAERNREVQLSESLKLALEMPGTGNYVEFAKECREAWAERDELQQRVKELERGNKIGYEALLEAQEETEKALKSKETLEQRLKAADELIARAKPYIDNGTDQKEFVCDECATSKSPGMISVALALAAYREGRE